MNNLKSNSESSSLSVMSSFLQSQGLEPTWTRAHSRQECRSALPCPSPVDLPNTEIKPRSPTLQADSLLFELLNYLKISDLFVTKEPLVVDRLGEEIFLYQI